MSTLKLADIRILPLSISSKVTTCTNFNPSSSVKNLSQNPGRSHHAKRPQKKHLSIDSIINSSKAKSPSVSTMKSSFYNQKEVSISNFPSQKGKSIKNCLSKNTVLSDHEKSYSDLFIDIETRFQEISIKKQGTGLNEEVFEEFSKIFEDIIFALPALKEVLQGVKKNYEEWILIKSRNLEEISRLRQKIFQIERNYESEVLENQSLIKKIQKISKENLELGKNNEDLDRKCEKLQKYLIEINEISLEQVPLDERTWKVVLCKNSKYKEMISKMENRIKSYKEKLKMNLALFASLTELGFPIKSLCKKFVSDCHKSDMSSFFSEYLDSDEQKVSNGILDQLDNLELSQNE
jgi:hypothetical protein